jgi:SAM-dependent methyltransferase/alkylhydroperoxidase family enzyme
MSSEAIAPWEVVDAGWGRAAAEFATVSEPGNCREYVSLHQRLGVGPADRLLDVACGAGLAVELAALRGASCAGIDASARLVAVARDRNPTHDLRVGDMHALPWDDESFDVVTSFRGIWGTTPDALGEVRRVLAPGGRVGLTVWGHLKPAPGSWALAPFRLAAPSKVSNQAAMVSLGRPGVGEALLAEHGFVDIERIDVPFVWEFPDPAAYARAIATTGPAHEAIANVGADRFLAVALEAAERRVRDGLPLRAELPVVGYVARRPPSTTAAAATGHLIFDGDHDADVNRFLERCREQVGFVMNTARVWSRLPDQHDRLFALLDDAAHIAGLTFRHRGVLVTACAAALGDSYCALAWSRKLAVHSGDDVAVGVLTGSDEGLTATDRALAGWARRVASDPNRTIPDDLEPLRACGYDDRQIFAITLFIGLRIAFASINDALGVLPDHELDDDSATRRLVTFGRRIATCT